jgi:hypothetical protein
MTSLRETLRYALNKRVYAKAFGKNAAGESFDSYTLLLDAGQGNTKGLKHVLDKNPTQQQKDEALAAAVQHSQYEATTILLDAGANPMAGDGMLLRKAEVAFGRSSPVVALLRNRAVPAELQAYEKREAPQRGGPA